MEALETKTQHITADAGQTVFASGADVVLPSGETIIDGPSADCVLSYSGLTPLAFDFNNIPSGGATSVTQVEITGTTAFDMLTQPHNGLFYLNGSGEVVLSDNLLIPNGEAKIFHFFAPGPSAAWAIVKPTTMTTKGFNDEIPEVSEILIGNGMLTKGDYLSYYRPQFVSLHCSSTGIYTNVVPISQAIKVPVNGIPNLLNGWNACTWNSGQFQPYLPISGIYNHLFDFQTSGANGINFRGKGVWSIRFTGRFTSNNSFSIRTRIKTATEEQTDDFNSTYNIPGVNTHRVTFRSEFILRRINAAAPVDLVEFDINNPTNSSISMGNPRVTIQRLDK